jgi:DNA-binding MarR family transcriptional regulator
MIEVCRVEKCELSGLLYEFLEAIYLFQRREEGLFGASWQDIFLLKRLDSGGELPVGGVAEALRVPLFGASRIVSRLHDRGLVVKRRSRENGRCVRVDISAAGRRLLKRVEDYQFRLIGGNIGLLEATEVESISAGIKKLRSLLAIE